MIDTRERLYPLDLRRLEDVIACSDAVLQELGITEDPESAAEDVASYYAEILVGQDPILERSLYPVWARFHVNRERLKRVIAACERGWRKHGVSPHPSAKALVIERCYRDHRDG